MTNSLQFSLVVSQESGVMSRVIKLLMEFQYMPLSRETYETSDPKKPNLVVIAKGNGSLKKLLSQLEKLKGVISIFKIEDYNSKKRAKPKTHLTRSIEKSKAPNNRGITFQYFNCRFCSYHYFIYTCWAKESTKPIKFSYLITNLNITFTLYDYTNIKVFL